MFFRDGFLQNVDCRVAEFNLHSTAGADKMVVVFMSPDMFIPYPTSVGIILNKGPADDSCFREQGKVSIHRGERHRIPMLVEEGVQVVGLKMTVHIASRFQ